MSKDNRYEKKAAKSSMVAHLTEGLPTKHNIKNTLLESGKDLVIGVLGGGLVGAAIGKPSLLVGLGVTGIGHFTDQRLATLFGIGIMASNGFQTTAVSGLQGMDGVKERIAEYKENFAEKLYLEHIVPKKGKDLDGIGELQFFNYNNDIDELRDELSAELKTLEKIEKQISDSGATYAKNTGMNMNETDMDDDETDEYDRQDALQNKTAPVDTSKDFDPTESNI